MSNAIAKLYRQLEAFGYPQGAIAWLKQRRLAVIVLLAILAWVVLLLGLWLGWTAFSTLAS